MKIVGEIYWIFKNCSATIKLIFTIYFCFLAWSHKFIYLIRKKFSKCNYFIFFLMFIFISIIISKMKLFVIEVEIQHINYNLFLLFLQIYWYFYLSYTFYFKRISLYNGKESTRSLKYLKKKKLFRSHIIYAKIYTYVFLTFLWL